MQPIPPQASYQHQAIWIGLMAVAIADLCLFAHFSKSQAFFKFEKALNFCQNAPSYSKLMSIVENMPIQNHHSSSTNVIKVIKQILNPEYTKKAQNANTSLNTSNEHSIINANIDIMLDILKQNRNNFNF